MSGVQRYSIEPPSAIGAPYEHGEWVRFTDHEAALAAARMESARVTADYMIEAGDRRTAHAERERLAEGYENGWNAALDAVVDAFNGDDWVSEGDHANAVDVIAALRKTPPQPEPLTREEQNERWRQDYNTQARLRKVDDWRLTEYPKPFEDAPAAQPEVAWVDGPEGPSC